MRHVECFAHVERQDGLAAAEIEKQAAGGENIAKDGRNGRALYAEVQAGDEKRVKYNIGDSAEHVEQDGGLYRTLCTDEVCKDIGKHDDGRAKG